MLQGRVLDYGCGRPTGLLADGARRQPHGHRAPRAVARAEALPIEAFEANLRTHELRDAFDAVACIGLLMFFGRPAARSCHAAGPCAARRIAAVNMLVEVTTYLDMFDAWGTACSRGTSWLGALMAGRLSIQHTMMSGSA